MVRRVERELRDIFLHRWRIGEFLGFVTSLGGA